jgi:hypothetical protein
MGDTTEKRSFGVTSLSGGCYALWKKRRTYRSDRSNMASSPTSTAPKMGRHDPALEEATRGYQIDLTEGCIGHTQLSVVSHPPLL